MLKKKNVTRDDVEGALRRLGFVLEVGRKTSHRQWSGRGVKISVPGHGPRDLTKKHWAMILRALRSAGVGDVEIEEAMR